MIKPVSFFRFFYIIILAIYHFIYFQLPFDGLRSGFAVVEFFFILSGVFMYRSFRKKNLSVFDYGIGRFKRFALEVYLWLFILFLLRTPGLFANHSVSESLQHILWEVLLLNQVLPLHDSISSFNAPTWFIGVLLYGGVMVYSFLKLKELGLKFILPVLVFGGYCFLLHCSPSLEQWSDGHSMIRGVAGLGVGVMLGWYIENRPGHSAVLDAVSLVAFPLSVYLMFLDNVNGFLFVVLFSIIIIESFDKESFYSKIFRSDIWNKLGMLSMPIFIIHFNGPNALVESVLNIVFPNSHIPTLLYMSCYLVAVFILALVYKFVCDRLRKSSLLKHTLLNRSM